MLVQNMDTGKIVSLFKHEALIENIQSIDQRSSLI